MFEYIVSLGTSPGGSVVKNLPANAEDLSSIPELERSPEGRHGNSLQYSCLENTVDRGAWWATVHWVADESDTIEQHTHQIQYARSHVKTFALHYSEVLKHFFPKDQRSLFFHISMQVFPYQRVFQWSLYWETVFQLTFCKFLTWHPSLPQIM